MMTYLIVDVSSWSKTSLFAGADKENGRKVEHNGKVVQVNSATYGYDVGINSITNCIRTLGVQPRNVILVREQGSSKSMRRNIFHGYKQGDSNRPPELIDNLNQAEESLIQAMLDLGAIEVCQPNIEADDVIGWLVPKLPGRRVIYSNDGDLAVLMEHEGVSMWRQGEHITSNPYGPFPCRFITLMKALIGDSSDTYPGAAGFGPKAWETFYYNYFDYMAALEGMVIRRQLHDLADDVKSFKPFQKLIDNAEMVYSCYQLALLHPEWVDRVRSPLKWRAGMVKRATDYRLKPWGANYRLVTADTFERDLQSLKSKIAETPEFVLDLETSACDASEEWLAQRTKTGGGVDVMGSSITGCGLTFGSNLQFGLYFSVDHSGTNNVTLEQLSQALESIPQDKLTVAHNAHGFELPVLYNAFGQSWKNNGWRGFFPNMVDSQLASTYWDENQMSTGLKTLSKLLLNYDQTTYEEVTTKEGRVGSLTGGEIRRMWEVLEEGAPSSEGGVIHKISMESRQYRMNQLTAQEVLSYGMDDCYTSAGLYNFFRLIMILEGTYTTFLEQEMKPMYLAASSYVQGTPFDPGRLRSLQELDDREYPRLEGVFNNYLVANQWSGTLCPSYQDELTPAHVKEIVHTCLGHTLVTQVRKVDKLAKLIAELEHEDAHLVAEAVANQDLETVNALVRSRFQGRPDFNTGSPKQVGDLLYRVMGLPIRLRNKPTDKMREAGLREGTPQTDEDAINLAIKMGDTTPEVKEALEALLGMKTINTRRSLYWEPYPKLMHWRTGRLHPDIRQCSTNTRRHSSANPNIQQQDSSPGGVRTTIKAHHSKAVVVSLDLAGQEIRLMGEYSQDPNIMAAYIGDPPKDLHSFTAAMIMGLTYEDYRRMYDEEEAAYKAAKSRGEDGVKGPAMKARDSGKTTFFASLYGAMAPKIALGLGISEELASSYLEALERAFPNVKPWKEETEQFASDHGWVPILGGTRRHLRELLLSDNKFTASKARRQASNARIQGAGGNQIRRIMSMVWDSRVIDDFDARFYWPVHDELVFSVHRDHAVEVIPMLHKLMCSKFLPTLPSSSSIGIGPNYGDLIEIGEVPDPALIQKAVNDIFAVREVAITS